MANILVTCDNFNPSVIPIWKYTWDELKRNHPTLRVTVFTVPLWKGRSQNDVFQNKDFKKWFRERKSWVEIQQQGYEHKMPPECKRFRKPQQAMIKRGFRKIYTYLPQDCYIFKAPYDQMDHNTLSILQDLGFTACVRYRGLILLRKAMMPIPQYRIITSHINIDDRHPDDIQKIWKKLDKEFNNLVSEGNSFFTLSQIIKECVE